jgi:predicted Zn-dependent peptidase
MLEFQRFDLPGSNIRLSVLPTKKLKTAQVKVYFPGNLDETVTRRALVPMVLRRGTRDQPDMQAIQKHLEFLYGASVVTDVNKVGEWDISMFRLEAVNDRFVPGDEEVFADALRFLRQFIFDPHLNDGKLREDYVDQEKNNLGRMIESLLDQKDQYAVERLIGEMCRDEPFHRHEYGDVADLPGITAESLTKDWREWSRSFPCEIYVTGDLDPDRTRGLIEDTFAVERDGGYDVAPIPSLRQAGDVRYFREEMAVNQGKLCLGYRCGTNYAQGDLEGTVLMNGVLGSFSHSKLFQNVREKASLAYDVHSVFEKTKGLVFVVSGIAVENYDQALEIIRQQVDAMCKGEITDDELDSTRESFDNHLQMLEDNLGSYMEVDFLWRLHGQEFDLAEYRKRLRAVTRDRIVAAAQSLQLDSVFFLTSKES